MGQIFVPLLADLIPCTSVWWLELSSEDMEVQMIDRVVRRNMESQSNRIERGVLVVMLRQETRPILTADRLPGLFSYLDEVRSWPWF